MRKLLLAGAAAAAVFSLASQANAATVIINASHVVGSDTVSIGGTIDGGAVPFPNVMEGPEAMNVSINGGPPQDILAFCVDLFHLWSGSYAPATYETAGVTHNSDSPASGGGTILPDLISGEIGYLAQIGQTTSDDHRLAGIQGAIWQIEYPDITLSGGSTYVGAYLALGAAWAAAHPNFHGHANGIYAANGQTQGFGFTQGFATGGAPEPAAWALMITGFGLAGATLRRRRSALA